MPDSPSSSLPSADLDTGPRQRPTPASPSRLISSVLSPAVRLWLRSQLEEVEHLQVTLEAGDRQLLAGTIQRIAIKAQNAVYRGLHLTQVEVAGEQIQTNLRQLLRGQPFRLLASFPVTGSVQLAAADLNQSLRSPLLAQAVIDFLLLLLHGEATASAAVRTLEAPAFELQNPQITLQADRLTLIANLLAANGQATPIAIRTGLQLETAHVLKLVRPQWLPHASARQGLPLRDFDGYLIDLGPQVDLSELTIATEQITCRGQILVTPDE